MKSTANHTIHKQTLEVRFNDFTTALKWNAASQATTAEAVRRSIEQCFQKYDATKEYLTIDKLELDLGAFSTEQLLSKMPEKLSMELREILSSYHMDLNDFEDAEIIEDVSSKTISPAPNADKKIASLVVKNSEATAFLFFLQNGYLPWWCPDVPAWSAEWLQKLTRENWQELRNFLMAYQENEAYFERTSARLISQFTDGFLASLLNGLQLKEPVEKAWSWFTNFYETLQKAETGLLRNDGSLPLLSVLRQHFWEKWISYAVGRSAIPELATLFALIKQPSLISSVLSGSKENKEWMDSLPEFWHGQLINLRYQEHKTELSIGSEFVNHAKSEKFKELAKTRHTDKASHSDKEDFILVPDSGLVLLYPFLPRLFENCNWLYENEFANDQARNQAVNALHYLAAGDEETPEYVLMLPKLLCGIPIEWPLEPVLPLSDAEKAACDEMLVQVIAHWTALRNTSAAGLRESFLQRQGKLFSTNDGWRLEVQRKTEDVLLNRLPWGFSMIKLFWMPRLLSVYWQ